jgi:arylsulfatase A-like enzyme
VPRPNLLFVLTDQLRAQALGCYGNERVDTPTIDRLADDGLRFETAVSTNPVCTPARGCIQTGRYAHEHRAIMNWAPLREDLPTLGTCFADAGYRTGYVGKWHLDGETGHPETIDFGSPPGFVPPGPRRRGYGFWRGFNDGHDHHDGHPRFTRDGEYHRERPGEYQPTVQTDIAREFVERNREEPWFLFLSWGPPHPPFDAPADYADRYEGRALDLRPNVPPETEAVARENVPEYYGMITSLDDELQRLLSTLDDLGLAEDTVVVFASDHGEMMGSHGMARGKSNPYEESIRVPSIIRYPRAVDGGRVSEAIASSVDYLPTLASLCDVPIPEGVRGRDLSAHVRGEAAPPDEAAYLQGALAGDGWRAVRTDRYLFAVDRRLGPRHLYDLREDPYQTRNLVGERDRLVDDLLETLVERAYDCRDRQITSHAFRRGSPWGPFTDE